MERKIFNYESIILPELTLEKEGFDPNTTGYQKKHIWAICRYCGNPNRVIGANFKKSGSACHKECRLKEQSESGSPFSDPEIKRKAEENRTKNVSIDEINRRISVGRKKTQHKVEETNLEKYGVKNVFQNEEIKEKIKQTNLEKYGVEHPTQNINIKNKIKQTNLNKYGVNNPTQNENIYKKIKETNLERYGYESPTQSEEIKEKIKQTSLDKFGVNSPSQNEEIKKQVKKYFKETYGVDAPLQLEEFLEKAMESFAIAVKNNVNGCFDNINCLRNEQFWLDMEKGMSLMELCDKHKINYNSIRTHLLGEEFRERYYKTYTFPKNQMQKEIYDFINSFGYETFFNKKNIIPNLELDIYLPQKRIAIEFNGSYWHSEAILNSVHARHKHYEKTRLCSMNNIRLIQIFENDWIKRKEQWKTFLKSAFGFNTIKIDARKCIIKEDMGLNLCELYHTQGKPKSYIKTFDLIHENEWIGSMVFGKHHRTNENNEIVLSRLVFKDNITVRGGSSKLFKYAINWAKTNNFNKIISWSDNACTEGNIYKTLNFKLDEELPINYFYWDMKNNTYVSKQSQSKKKSNCPIHLTEREWALERKLYRIWDCGKKRWIYNL